VQDGPAPVRGAASSLTGVVAANWLSNDRLIVVAEDGQGVAQLEVRSRDGALVEVLDRPELAPGQRSAIQFRLSPERTRIAWKVTTYFRDPSSQQWKEWFKVSRLAF
jgi:hypothetical protein